MALHSRIKRVNEELRTIIADVVQNEIKDPRLTDVLITITQVFTAKDLGQAQVYVSVLGDEEKTREAMAALQQAHGFIKREVASRITMRHMPELTFKFDDTSRSAANINSLLRKIERDNPAAFQAPVEEGNESAGDDSGDEPDNDGKPEQ